MEEEQMRMLRVSGLTVEHAQTLDARESVKDHHAASM
jgi:hypothetical protein